MRRWAGAWSATISPLTGNDPTTPSTDHSREYLPLLVYSPSNARGRDLGVRRTLADIGATAGALWGVDALNGEPIEL